MTPLKRVLSRWALAGAAACAAVGLAAPQAAAAPTPEFCLDETIVSSFQSSGGPFSGGTRLAWLLHPGCPNVTFKLRGASIGNSGSKVVNPQSTAQYELTAHVQGQTRVLGSRYALAGNVVGYYDVYGVQWFPHNGDYTGRGAPEARAFAAEVTDSLSQTARSKLLGKVLQLHLIPEEADLTDLYPWQDLADVTTCELVPDDEPCVDDRPYSTLRGVGGEIYGDTDRIVFAAGVETVRESHLRTHFTELGHILVHELGHTVLDFATSTAFENSVAGLLAQRGPDADYPGDDAYASSNVDEYWAQGTAALFGYGGPRDPVTTIEHAQAAEFSVQWLQANDPLLLAKLQTIYPHRS